MGTKKCSGCNEDKPLDQFTKDKRVKSGLSGWCKVCAREYDRLYKERNRDRLIESNKKYREENKEHISRWHGEYRSAYRKHKKEVDPIYKITEAIRCSVNYSFKRACGGVIPKRSKSADILGCSFETFVQYIEGQLTDGMTLGNYGEWHLDHIIPISSATTEEDIIRLNHYTNFQPLWAMDNFKKGAKIVSNKVASN